MQRQIKKVKRIGMPCCPGHDRWPDDTYNSRRSKKARARDIKREHRYVRRVIRQQDIKIDAE